MMYCPVCKSEFKDEFEFCPTCKCSLVEELPEEERKDPLIAQVVFLTNVRDEYEAAIVESIMTSNNIKILKKYREAGDYLNIYMGNSVLGIDIYVPESDYETAMDLIGPAEEARPEEDNKEFAEEEMPQEQDENITNKSRSLKAWIILIFFTSGIFALVIYLITIMMRVILK